MSTGEIVAVGAAVVALGGGVLFVLHRQNAAALAASTQAAAAARAAAGAKNNDFDLGRALTELGGLVIDKGIAYLGGGPAGVAASEARAGALLV